MEKEKEEALPEERIALKERGRGSKRSVPAFATD